MRRSATGVAELLLLKYESKGDIRGQKVYQESQPAAGSRKLARILL